MTIYTLLEKYGAVITSDTTKPMLFDESKNIHSICFIYHEKEYTYCETKRSYFIAKGSKELYWGYAKSIALKVLEEELKKGLLKWVERREYGRAIIFA